MTTSDPSSGAKDQITKGSNVGLPSSPHQVQGGHCEAAQTSGDLVKESKPDEATAEPSTTVQRTEHASATTKPNSQSLASNEVVAAQGIHDRSTSQHETALPSPVIDKDKGVVNAGLNGHDEGATIAKNQPDPSQQVAAAADVDANLAQYGRPSDKVSSPRSSSSSPLLDALNAAEKSIFDAYKDLTAHLTSVSKEGQPDELLTSALYSVEAAMKNIIAAQLAAASSATHGSGAEPVGYDGTPSLKKPKCNGQDEGQLAKTQSSKSETSSAQRHGAPSTTTPQHGAPSTTMPQHMLQPSGVSMLPGASSSKPDGPLDNTTTTANCIIKTAARSSTSRWGGKVLVSTDDVKQSDAYRRWHEKVESLWPGAGATEFLDSDSIRRDGKDKKGSTRHRHADWEFAQHRMMLNAPKGKGKAEHFYLPGKRGVPLPRSEGVPLPTMLRPTAKRMDKSGLQDQQPKTDWTSMEIREHRL